MSRYLVSLATGAAIACALTSTALLASSHREAPFITEMPKVDGTDFYMFRSYGSESTADSVTLIANYQPLQDAYGGPNYFTLDPNALYEIHVDNDGDAVEDITFQFRFRHIFRNASLGIGAPITEGGTPTNIGVPLVNLGTGNPNDDNDDNDAIDASVVGTEVDDVDGLNILETYRVTVVRDGRRSNPQPPIATNADGTGESATIFRKPVDNIGEKTIPDYATYANNHIFNIDLSTAIPGCSTPGRVFVGQRKEGFVVNLGAIFDRVNLDPLGARNSGGNRLDDKNITSIALEVPSSCLVDDSTGDPVIGAWTTASLRQARALNPLPSAFSTQDGEFNTASVEGGPWTQVSRLGSPLVNEVVIGLVAKDRFNASEPRLDLNANIGFAPFILTPTLPVLIDALFPGATTVPETPRDDLVAAFVTGVPGLNQPLALADESEDTGLGGEMLRLDTSRAPTPLIEQSDLGFLGCDLAGFPNGRRPIDDVVDIALTVVEGAITADNPNQLQTCDVATETVMFGGAVVNDGAQPQASDYLPNFPYLNIPLSGAENP